MAGQNAETARAISSAVAGVWAQRFGRGPETTRTYFNDDNVIVVLHGGLFAHEQALVASGRENVVRELRHQFEQTIGPELRRIVAEQTGSSVRSFDSHILFDPPRTFELFVLGE